MENWTFGHFRSHIWTTWVIQTLSHHFGLLPVLVALTDVLALKHNGIFTNSLVAAHLKRQSWVTQLIVVKRNPERSIGFHVRRKQVGAQQRAPFVLGCLAGSNTVHNLQLPHAKLTHFYFLRTSCQVLWAALMFRWIYCWDKTKQNPNWLALFLEYVPIHRRDPLQIFLLSTENQAIWPQHP